MEKSIPAVAPDLAASIIRTASTGGFQGGVPRTIRPF